MKIFDCHGQTARLLLLAGPLLVPWLAGCGVAQGPSNQAVSVSQSPYRLEEEPADSRDVLEVRALLEEMADASVAPVELTVTGRVTGLNQPTWDPDRAVFMIADQSLVKADPGHAGDPTHDADACPFCRAKKRKELAGLAMIQVLDAHGDIPAVDARDLLGLSEGEMITVRGEARLDSLGTLVVRTRSVFVRP
jgi:hypothetical protein